MPEQETRLPDGPSYLPGSTCRCVCCKRAVFRAENTFVDIPFAAVCRDCSKHVTAWQPADCEFAATGEVSE